MSVLVVYLPALLWESFKNGTSLAYIVPTYVELC